MNEQQRRLYPGTEALKIGSGGISQVAALSGADWKTVQRGVKELKGERARAAQGSPGWLAARWKRPV